MRKIILSISLFTIAIFAYAQTGIIKTHKATNGKLLSMPTAVNNWKIYPQQVQPNWVKDKVIYYDFGKNKYVEYSFKTGEISNYTPNTKSKFNFSKELKQEISNSENIKEISDKIAYTNGNNLFIADTLGNKTLIAKSNNPNISYGQIVSRNEFNTNSGIFWSPNKEKIAFYQKDESEVGTFPLLNIKTRTGSLVNIKYPMNGMGSEILKLGIYNFKDSSTVYANVTDFGKNRYLTNITWSPDSKYIFIQVLNRAQKNMNLNMYDATTGKLVKTLLTENNDKFVEPLDPIYFIKGTYYFIYKTNNRNQYKNLYICDTLGHVRRLTDINADVEYIGNNGKYVYYTSAQVSPVENHLFRISLKHLNKKIDKIKFGKSERLTKPQGWHNIYMNNECSYYFDNYSSFNKPTICVLHSTDNKLNKVIHQSANPLKGYKTGDIYLGKIKSADGKYDNYYRMYKPADFDSTKKYPVILYVYGGPHSQLVQDKWLGNIRMWELYMAERGYIVYIQDNRGTLNRGQLFENCIHNQCGQLEMADQMEGIKMLKSLPYVDSTRIGVHGWSYGGFMTISLITNYPKTFKAAVAGGPVIDWKWYEVMYGERYMETEKTNPNGFAKVSLMNKAKDLKGKLLICQGAIDKTVLWENSLSFVQECIEKNIQLDYFPYPCSEHNVRGTWRINLMTKVSDYFDRNL